MLPLLFANDTETKNLDIAMGDSGVRRAIVAKLTALYPGVYNENNIGLVGTHQHAGVGGFLEVRIPGSYPRILAALSIT